MKRENCKNKKQVRELDALNNERVTRTLNRVAHAIELIDYPAYGLLHEHVLDIEKVKLDIAHAGNILESASEEMQWACDWFEWNDDICRQIDNSIAKIGHSLSQLVSKVNDIMLASSGLEDAQAELGKALCTLVRWFDDTADVSEV